MRKIIFTTVFSLIALSLLSQAPQKFSFQAVVRNNQNQLIINQQVGVRTSIIQGSTSGTVVYQEFYYPNQQTNANGLITLEIGSGFVLSGDFSAINWANGPYYIKTEADPTGGTNYTITGTSQLMSVPYSLHSKTAESLTQPIIETDPVFSSWDKSSGIEITESQIIDLDHFTNADEIDPVFSSWDKSTGIEITESQIIDLKDYLTEEADGDPTNELQTVVQEDYKVTLSHDGGSFITGIMSYAQDEIDAIAPYDGLTVHNNTTNCINYYYLNNWFEVCGTCTPQPTQADAGEDILIMGGVLTVTLSANIPVSGEGKWSILSGDGGSFEDDSYPQTVFTGQSEEEYTLQWAITTSCNTSYDEIKVKFYTWICGMPFTDSRDDQSYNTVLIGDQCWMAENLKYLPSVVGPGTGSETIPYYYVYGYNGTNVNDAKATTYYNAYGVLYNWPAAVNACPPGWHLPSDAEWTQLVDYLDSQGFPNDWENPNSAGNALKSCRQVNSPLGEDCATSEHPRWNSDNTHYGFDEFGFSALPGGYRSYNGNFFNVGGDGVWWSSNEDSSTYAWFRYMFYSYGTVYRFSNFKSNGYSVRCLRD